MLDALAINTMVALYSNIDDKINQYRWILFKGNTEINHTVTCMIIVTHRYAETYNSKNKMQSLKNSINCEIDSHEWFTP